MVQAENEFGSYVAQRKDIPLEEHRKYSHKIKDMLLKGASLFRYLLRMEARFLKVVL